jgi:putative redox protein
MLQASVTLTHPSSNNRQFLAENNRGHQLTIDDPTGNTGPKPVELVAIGLAGCTAFDVINILRKKRQQVTDYKVTLEADQASEPPQTFTDVRIHHILTGVDISSDAVKDAIRLSEEKYCSVGAMIGKSAKIHTTFQIIPVTEEVGAGR